MFSWVNRRTLTTGNNIGKQEQGSEENTRTNVLYNKAQVLLIGTSNIKYINSRFIAGSKAYVYKVQKFTIEEALKYIKDVTFENKPTCSPKVVIYHILCNDIEKYETAVLTKNMEELVANTKSKFPNSKIMISLRLPRIDPEFNLRVNTTNITLQNLFCSDPSVEICDNSNLFYRGYPQRGISSFKKRSSGTSQQFEGWTIPHDMTIREYLKIGNWNIHSLKSRLYDKSTDKTFLWEISHYHIYSVYKNLNMKTLMLLIFALMKISLRQS